MRIDIQFNTRIVAIAELTKIEEWRVEDFDYTDLDDEGHEHVCYNMHIIRSLGNYSASDKRTRDALSKETGMSESEIIKVSGGLGTYFYVYRIRGLVILPLDDQRQTGERIQDFRLTGNSMTLDLSDYEIQHLRDGSLTAIIRRTGPLGFINYTD